MCQVSVSPFGQVGVGRDPSSPPIYHLCFSSSPAFRAFSSFFPKAPPCHDHYQQTLPHSRPPGRIELPNTRGSMGPSAHNDRASRPPRRPPAGVCVLSLDSYSPLPPRRTCRLSRICCAFPLASAATARPRRPASGTLEPRMLLPEHHVLHLRPRLVFEHPATPPPIFDPHSLRPRDDAAHPISRRCARARPAPRRAALHRLFLYARARRGPPRSPPSARARTRAPLFYAGPFRAAVASDLPPALRASHAGRALTQDLRHVP